MKKRTNWILYCPCGSQGARDTGKGIMDFLDSHKDCIKTGQSIAIQPSRT